MEPAVKSSLLWGAVGALAFLVLGQGYGLVIDEFVSVGLLVGIAAVVGGVTAVVTHVVRPYLRAQYG
jgi:hypothetical protein